MDRRIAYRMVLDTETCPIKVSDDVDPNNMLVYDIGWAIVDKRGNVYATRSFVVREIFLGEFERFKSGYYSNKLPIYVEDIANGSRVLANWNEICEVLHNDCKEWGIKEVYAHNARFDCISLSVTRKWLNGDYMTPYGIVWCDTCKMARQVVAKTPTYKAFCVENGYLTKNGRVQVKAEVLYKYITTNKDFVESHTGLEDVLIEKDIMKYCFAKHKKMDRLLWGK